MSAVNLAVGIPDSELDLHPFCNTCGWRKGGLHCWDKDACKCGHYEPSFRSLFAAEPTAAATHASAPPSP